MYIEMNVSGITLDPLTSMPIVILKDIEEKNVIPIWIGILEANSIAMELEKKTPSRPMTHDLLRNILGELEATVTRIEVTDLRDNTFYANIYMKVGSKELVIDSRPSDAIALALRMDAKIFVNEEVIEKSRRIDLGKDKEEKSDKEKWTEILENLPPEDFGKYKM